MTTRFDEIYERLGLHEGGYTDDPNDRGNWTSGQIGVGELKGSKKGISAMSYPHLDIKNLTDAEIKEIYLRDFWNKLRCDDIPPPLDEFVFDFGVNSGTGTAAASLQGAVGTLRDGVVGPKTVAAIARKPLMEIFRQVFVDRAMIFALSPVDKLYGRGWFARLFDKTVTAIRAVG